MKLPKEANKALRAFVDRSIVHEKMKIKGAWPREMTFAKRMWEMCPDVSFWENFKLDRRIDSLILLTNDAAREKMKHMYTIHMYEPPKQEEEQVDLSYEGEDSKVKKKLTPLDFMG